MSPPATWPVALTIAGSDSSGGAGVQADLKTFAAHQVYGASALTAVTAQNTQGVLDVFVLPPELVHAQLVAVLDDLPVAATKTGMLGSAAVVDAVTSVLKSRNTAPLVIDPVFRATSGRCLLDEAGVEAVRDRLLPLADLVTPNRDEAGLLSGMRDRDRTEQARCLVDLGAGAVLITGGDGTGADAVDLFFDGRLFHEFRRPRLQTPSTHGTGCTLSAAITAQLAAGECLVDGVGAARDYLQQCLENARVLGRGHGPLHHFHAYWETP